MIDNKHFSIFLLCGLCFVASSGSAATDLLEEQTIDHHTKNTFVAEQDDTFSSIAEREFGYKELAIALAVYNQLPFDNVFSAEQAVFYPSRFAAKPDSLEVVFSKGDVTYRPDGNEYLSGDVSQGDFFSSADTIVTGTNGFVSLALPSGDFINVQPDTRVSLDQLRCVPDDASCGVLINEAFGQIYVNIKGRNNLPGPITPPLPSYPATVRGPSFDYGSILKNSGRNWPIKR